jgi:tetratricopeptide (TPR) repeat protein
MTDERFDSPDADPFNAQNARAETLIEQGDYPLAAEVLMDILQKDPANFQAYNNLGVLSWAREKWLDAYVLFRKAVDLQPGYTDALANLFDAALKLKKVHEVLPCFETGMSFAPANEEIAMIYQSIKQLGTQIEDADKELDAGNLNSAMQLYLKSNDEEGPSAEAFSGLGVISYYQQRYEDAYTLFLEAIKINPSKSDILLNLLDSAKACGKTEQAREVFEMCVKEHQGLEELRKDFEG